MSAIAPSCEDPQSGREPFGPAITFADPFAGDALGDSVDIFWIDVTRSLLDPAGGSVAPASSRRSD